MLLERVRHFTFWNLARGGVLAVSVITLVSCLLFWWGGNLWQAAFTRHIPSSDNFNQARQAAAQAYLLQQRYLAGDPGVARGDVEALLEHALVAAGHAASGRSTLLGVEDHAPDARLAESLNRYRLALTDFVRHARARLDTAGADAGQSKAYAETERLAAVIDDQLLLGLTQGIKRQHWIQAGSLILWLLFMLAVLLLLLRAARKEAASHADLAREQAALGESEERLQLFIEHAPAALAMFDREMRYLAVSCRWMTDYGLAGRDILGQSHYAVFPEIPERWREVHRRGLAGEVVKAEEDHFERLDGSVQWLHWEVRPWRAADGNIGGIVVFTEDITQRRQADVARRESEARYRALVENSPDWVWEVDAEGVYTYSSPRVLDLLGYAPDELVGRTPLEFMPEAEARRVGAIFAAIAASRRPFANLENANLRKDGQRVILESSGVPIFGPDGVFLGYRGLDRDVSQRKQAEQALRQSEERFELAMRATDDGMWDWDLVTNAVYYSPRWKAMLGYREDELANEFATWERLVDPEGGRAALARVEELVAGQEDNLAVEYRMRHKDGHWLDVLARGLLLRDAAGRPTRMVGTQLDISERKRNELRMRQDREQQAALRVILETVMAGGDMYSTLERCLEQLMAVSWLSLQPRGGVFLMQPGDTHLRLFVAHNLSAEIRSLCALLPMGHCHCGRAAAEGEIQFSKCVDHLHQIHYPGMLDHGHYCLPLMSEQQVLGVLVLYCPAEMERDALQEAFLASVADILAGYLGRVRADEALAAHRAGLEAEVSARTAELRESWQRLEAIIESLPAVFFVKDAAGVYLSVNRQYETAVGITREDVLGRTDLDVYGPDMAEAFMRVDRQVLAGREAMTFEERAPHTDGTLHDYLTTKVPLLDGDGHAHALMGVAADITPIKRLQDELARAQAIAHVGSWRLDIVRDVLYWSEETYRIFGQEPGTPLDMAAFADRIHPQDRARVLAAWELALAGQPYDIEHRIMVGEGVKWVREQAQLQFDEDGQPVVALGSVQDITDLKRAESELRRALSEAERLARVKSDFLANMSHEIRTPLNAVLGLARIGARENKGRQSGDTCERILEAGEHLLGVINDILDYSRIEAGRLGVERRPFNLGAALAHVGGLLAIAAREKGLDYSVDLAPDLPEWVLGDAQRLRQVLINLLSNAVKFSDRGEVRLRVAREGEHIYFRVIDTGIGLTPDQIGRLFQPFEQADGSTTRKYGGTGLGLAISARLARMMGGEIMVDSAPGAGSAFTLRLRLEAAAPVPAGARGAPAEAGVARLEGVRVLAVEDVEVNRMILEDLLAHEGAQVVMAENGKLALERLQEAGVSAFDVVLMDVQMPEMDGYAATGRINAMAPGLPVIGLTAHALAEERQRCLAAGMVEHVTKPIDVDVLVAAIRARVDESAIRPARERGLSPAGNERTGVAAAGVGALIDWPALLARYAGRQGFVRKLAATALASNAENVEKLRLAVEKRDLAAVAFIAHSLKGTAGNLMAHGLHELAARTESAARDGRESAIALAGDLGGGVRAMLAELAGQLEAGDQDTTVEKTTEVKTTDAAAKDSRGTVDD